MATEMREGCVCEEYLGIVENGHFEDGTPALWVALKLHCDHMGGRSQVISLLKGPFYYLSEARVALKELEKEIPPRTYPCPHHDP